jgi:RNA polymerase sigma-70 factor (ECF subfamily)
VRDGDEDARERLGVRYLALLKRWAHGWVPPRARGFAHTDDLVQATLVRALGAVQHFEPRREGAFLAYLRTILLNQLRTAVVVRALAQLSEQMSAYTR